METRLAIRTAEYKKVWVATFERGCTDEGLACKVDDGRPAPEVKLLPEQPRKARERASEPATATPELIGRWEAAAREADPDLEDPNKDHDRLWVVGLFPQLINGATHLTSFPDVGKEARLVPWPAEDSAMQTTFREALARRGGVEPFECTVADLGEEVRPASSPLLDAAAKATGATTAEGPTWQIVCSAGDARSHLGTVVVTVPSYAAWTTLEGGRIARYHLERHGHWADELRDKLIDVGLGTKLVIDGVARLGRTTLKNVVFGQEWPTPIWRVGVGDWQCPHEGAGCNHLDGFKLPVIKLAKDSLKSCPVSTWVYPPPK